MTSRIIWVLGLAGLASAATAEKAADIQGVATYRLWEGDAPRAAGNRESDIPTLTIFRPQPGHENGTAMIVAPGGGYLGLASNLEGRQVADWFAARGITAFVLKYRLGKTYLFPTPLVDAQRAIRFVRSQAKQFGLSADRVGIMGFSAGGHLAASAATMFDAGNDSAADPIDRVSSKPDFLVLGYPWLNAMKKDEKSGTIPYCSVLKIPNEKCAFEQYSPDTHVSAQTPPTFIYHTTNDELVPVNASVIFYERLAATGVEVEAHLFAKGKHGTGLGTGDASLDAWPGLLEAWMRGRGLLTPDPAVVEASQRLAAPPSPRKPGAPFSADLSLRELLADTNAKAVLIRHLGKPYLDDLPEMAQGMSLRAVAAFDPDHLSPATLTAIDSDLNKVPH